MNTRILLLALSVAALSSCSSVYKSGQTPDDVYFSPARPQADEYVDVSKQKEEDRYQSYEEYQDNMRNDRFLRMSVGNPYYLNAYNGYDGFDWRYNSYNSYGYNSYYSYSSPWNNYYAWNNFYNPYCNSPYMYYGGGGYYHGNGGGKLTYATPISRPIAFNRNSYSNNPGSRPSRALSGNYNNVNTRYNNSNGSSNRYNYSNSNYSNSANHNNSGGNYSPSSNSNSTPSRSYTPSSSSGSSSSGSTGSGSVSRPGRGGR